MSGEAPAGRDEPLVTFYRILPGGPKPRRAMTDAAGTLPVSGYRFCEPVRLASAFGYYVFLPMSFQLEWDGGQGGLWSFDSGATWYPLSEAAYPDSMKAWDSVAPDFCKGWCPPFLTFSETPAMIQVWTGWMARTAPGWSLLVRGAANLPRGAGYDIMEGIVETDRWFGPLFMNLRLTRSEAPILFDHMRPILQVQPIHRSAYDDRLLDRVVVENEAGRLPPDLWQAYERSLVDPVVHHPKRGHYAVLARRRRAAEQRDACPFSGPAPDED